MDSEIDGDAMTWRRDIDAYDLLEKRNAACFEMPEWRAAFWLIYEDEMPYTVRVYAKTLNGRESVNLTPVFFGRSYREQSALAWVQGWVRTLVMYDTAFFRRHALPDIKQLMTEDMK